MLRLGRLRYGILVLASAASTVFAAEPFEGFDHYVQQAMQDWQVPGLALIVIDDGEIVFSQAYGVRMAGRPEAVDLDTVFALSSTGKAYTATLAATMVDPEKLGWDDPIAQHLDYVVLPDPWVTQQVTIRDMLSHRVAGDLGVGKLELWAFTALSRDDVLARLRFLDIGTPRFRAGFQYGNPNISAAGQAAAAAVGGNWDELMQKRILNALGMRRASTNVTAIWDEKDIAACYMCDLDHLPEPANAKIENIAMPHVASNDGPVPIPWRTVDNIAPAGSINSSVRDFARFVELHLEQGVIDGARIVSAEQIAEMHRPQIVVSSPSYPAVTGFSRHWSYGLGWFISEYRDHKLVMHTGGITGWRSGMVMLPEERLGVALVSNSHGPGLPNTLVPALAFVIFDRVLGLSPIDHSGEWLAATKAGFRSLADARDVMRSQRNGSAGPSIELASVTGDYWHPAFGGLVVDSAEKKLMLAEVMVATLEHWEGDRYLVSWRGPWDYPTFLEVSEDGLKLEGFGVFQRR